MLVRKFTCNIFLVNFVEQCTAAINCIVRSRGLHGNGDAGNTTVMGTTFTVIPWGQGHVSRG